MAQKVVMQTVEEFVEKQLQRILSQVEPTDGIWHRVVAAVESREHDVRRYEQSLAMAERIEIIWEARREERRKALMDAACEVCEGCNDPIFPRAELGGYGAWHHGNVECDSGRIHDLIVKLDAKSPKTDAR